MDKLGDIQWIFAKKGNINDLSTLKSKVIQALKTADGKPIEELEKLFGKSINDFSQKVSIWIGKRASSKSFLEWLDKLENFKKFFEIVD